MPCSSARKAGIGEHKDAGTVRFLRTPLARLHKITVTAQIAVMIVSGLLRWINRPWERRFCFMMERRVLTMRSQTLALRAKRVLLRQGISVRLVRPSPRLTPGGCAFGLEMEAGAVMRAMDILEGERMPFGEILDG